MYPSGDKSVDLSLSSNLAFICNRRDNLLQDVRINQERRSSKSEQMGTVVKKRKTNKKEQAQKIVEKDAP